MRIKKELIHATFNVQKYKFVTKHKKTKNQQVNQ